MSFAAAKSGIPPAGTHVLLSVVPGWLFWGTVETVDDHWLTLCECVWLEQALAPMVSLVETESDPKKIVSSYAPAGSPRFALGAINWFSITPGSPASLNPAAKAIRKAK